MPIARSVEVPSLFYGTAWKEEATEACVLAALRAGFHGIDTANQRKHYFEEGVGRGIAASGVARDAVFVQTKFTFRDGQDDRLPYDERASVGEQVMQSFASSLEHLGVTWLDSLVLHGPSRADGLGRVDREAWSAMEELARGGKVKLIGVSNVTARQAADVVAMAKVAPAFVQNRCYAARGWDRDVRAVCAGNGLVYQAFSVLTANRHVLANPGVRAVAAKYGVTGAQVVMRFAVQSGMIVLTGTKDENHMREDLAVAGSGLELETGELGIIAAAG
ncbi:MAG TPA: aldo/keto reductase [Kofleriaceae bacterium]|jgi:diketogulonate reductase-like aldo/keto reductase